jgi:dTDP-4-amino-4,6-dideoxygalactose transaminase
MPKIPLLDLHSQYNDIKEDVLKNINRVIESQQFILGPEVDAFENLIAEYSQCKHAIGVSSGSDALLASLMAIDVKPGDEVITTTFSFFATAGAIARLGARPIFADVCINTQNIDPDQIENLITRRTKAIIPVHFAGRMADMATILEVARRHGLYVIEDACQAIGAEYNGQRAGSLGDLGCFSFFPSKNLGGHGDSGMITTNNTLLADKVRLLRNHGQRSKYHNLLIGGNFRMDSMQAAILAAKFKYLETWTASRINHAVAYQKLFKQAGLANLETGYQIGNHTSLVLPAGETSGRHVYHLYVIRVSKRDKLKQFLQEKEITTEVYYPKPLHLQECFAYLGYHQGDLPVSELLTQEVLALPIYPELTPNMIEQIVDAITSFYTLHPDIH